MRLIIAGSRSVTPAQFEKAITRYRFVDKIEGVLSGRARGADQLGEQWARKNRKKIYAYPADWESFGKRAGYLRNQEMAKAADALLCLWDGQSKGSKHMIDLALKERISVCVYRTDLDGFEYHLGERDQMDQEMEKMMKLEKSIIDLIPLNLHQLELLQSLINNQLNLMEEINAHIDPELTVIRDKIRQQYDKLLKTYLKEVKA